jgi:hypothetical protein
MVKNIDYFKKKAKIQKVGTFSTSSLEKTYTMFFFF